MTTRSVTITLAHHTQTWTVTQARAWATRRARAQLADQGVDMVGDPRDWVHTTSHGHTPQMVADRLLRFLTAKEEENP
jgi:hypothetical protein